MPLTAREPVSGVRPQTCVALLVNFNSGEHLARCLESLARHAPDADVIVIDNASKDGSERTVQHDTPSLRLVRNSENVGFAAAVNQGSALRGDELLLLLNPDCRITPGAIESLRVELEAHPECALVGPRVLDEDGGVQGSARGDPDVFTGLFGRSTLMTRLFPRTRFARRNVYPAPACDACSSEVDWVSGACMLIRRAAFDAVGGFDERYFLYWEDADFCRRLRANGFTVRYVPAAAVIHKGGGSSRTARTLAIRAFHRSAFVYYSTHVRRKGPALATARCLLAVRCWWKLLASRFSAATRSE